VKTFDTAMVVSQNQADKDITFYHEWLKEQHSRVTFINGLEANPLFPPNITKESNPWVKLLPISDFLVQRAYDTEIRLRCDFAALPLDCQSLILGYQDSLHLARFQSVSKYWNENVWGRLQKISFKFFVTSGNASFKQSLCKKIISQCGKRLIKLEASHAAFLQRSDLELILENCPHLIYLDIKHCNHIGVLDCSKHEKLTTIVAVGCKDLTITLPPNIKYLDLHQFGTSFTLPQSIKFPPRDKGYFIDIVSLSGTSFPEGWNRSWIGHLQYTPQWGRTDRPYEGPNQEIMSQVEWEHYYQENFPTF